MTIADVLLFVVALNFGVAVRRFVEGEWSLGLLGLGVSVVGFAIWSIPA